MKENENIIKLYGNDGGKLFDGIGAVNGGGATSVLLKDYPEVQRKQILDLLFKPNFGASMSTVLVEVPGDCNSTQGAMPSHMHTKEDLNFMRGYTWWILSEAKKRNPDIKLDANAWGCPGWVGSGDFWSQDMCDYYVKWIQGLKSAHGLKLDAIGCRNEKAVSYDFVKKFRKTLNGNGLSYIKIHAFDNWGDEKFNWVKDLETDSELRDAVDIIGNHTMYDIQTPNDDKQVAEKYGKPIWNTEEHVYKQGFDCEISLVQAFNNNYIESDVTKIVVWYDIASFYPIEPYPEEPAAIVANSPWSGYYHVRESLWAYANYCQFVKVGWQYLSNGCGKLSEGGSFVTLKSEAGDYSIIIETKDACSDQYITFSIGDGLSKDNLCVWQSNLDEQFVHQNDISLKNNSFTVYLKPNTIYSLSTVRGQQKGMFADVPPNKSFPLPYYETCEEYTDPAEWGYLPHYTADICGIFEIADKPGDSGKCIRQTVSTPPVSWAPEWKPYTVIGDSEWNDYEISADVYLDGSGSAGVMGRVCDVGNGYGCTPKGYYLLLMQGSYVLFSISGDDSEPELGDKENRERLRMEGSVNRKGKVTLASGTVKDVDICEWHNLKLQFKASEISGFVDSNRIFTVSDKLFSHGMVGLITDGGDGRSTAYFTNLLINKADAAAPKDATCKMDALPIYRSSAQ